MIYLTIEIHIYIFNYKLFEVIINCISISVVIYYMSFIIRHISDYTYLIRMLPISIYSISINKIYNTLQLVKVYEINSLKPKKAIFDC